MVGSDSPRGGAGAGGNAIIFGGRGEIEPERNKRKEQVRQDQLMLSGTGGRSKSLSFV